MSLVFFNNCTPSSVAQSVFAEQFREEEGGPFCERLGGARSWGGGGAPTRREDVALPAEGGWRWTSEWQARAQAVEGGYIRLVQARNAEEHATPARQDKQAVTSLSDSALPLCQQRLRYLCWMQRLGTPLDATW